MRITDILRDSFNDVVITGSYIINKVLNVKVHPEGAVNEAEVLSSMFRDTAVLTDDLGLLNSLGALGIARVRGSLVIFVFDLHDVRSHCELMGLPCLEPWDGEALVKAIKESRDYSEAFEVPYVIRLGPWLNIDDTIRGLGIRHREPTFNKNWNEPMKWGLHRLLRGTRREIPKEAFIRSQDNVNIIGKGDEILVSGSAWPFVKGVMDKFNDYSLVLPLYVNPLPRDAVGIKYVIDTGDYLPRKLNASELMSDTVSNWYSNLVQEAVKEIFFRREGDPLMLIEWLLSKYKVSGEVPVIAIDVTYAHLVSSDGSSPSYDMLPTFFEPRDFDQIVDIVSNPLTTISAYLRSRYEYGRLIVVSNPCTLISQGEVINEIMKHRNKYLLIIITLGNKCKDYIDVLTKSGIEYRVINYDPNAPLDSLQALLSIVDSRGVVIINVLDNADRHVFKIDEEYCDNCGDCLRIGCPAIQLSKKPIIDPNRCVGCGICQLVCIRGAIMRVSTIEKH